MMEFKYTLIFIFVFHVFSFSQEKDSKSKGELICLNNKIDNGIVKADSIIQNSFIFKNIGSEKIRITQINVSCNCSKSQIADSIILPSEEAELFIEIDTKEKRVGKHRVTAILQTNGQRRFYKLTSLLEIR